MFKRYMLLIITLCTTLLILFGCRDISKPNSFKPKAVATTEVIANATSIIGGDFVYVSTIMSPGNDPHTYNATEYDVIKIASSDLVLYSGFYLEGRLQEVLKKINRSIPTVSVSLGIDNESIIPSDSLSGGSDPHFWMDVRLWMNTVSHIADTLVKTSPINERIYRKNEELYLMKLSDLDKYIRSQISKIPEEKRILITVHEAFNYFGKAYGFKTAALQSSDTDSEISSADISRLSNYIIANGIEVIFTEISVPRRNIKTLQAALNALGYDVKIGGTLYSDTLGGRSSKAADYIGMMTYNIDTIVKALASGVSGNNK